MNDTERVRNWRRNHRESYNEYMRDYARITWKIIEQMLVKSNTIWFERDYRKKSKLIDATPSWVDENAIRDIYAECVRLSRQTGVSMTVDHEIPIAGKTVCGLHVPDNLKVVSENFKRMKGRKFRAKKVNQDYWNWLKAKGL